MTAMVEDVDRLDLLSWHTALVTAVRILDHRVTRRIPHMVVQWPDTVQRNG